MSLNNIVGHKLKFGADIPLCFFEGASMASEHSIWWERGGKGLIAR